MYAFADAPREFHGIEESGNGTQPGNGPGDGSDDGGGGSAGTVILVPFSDWRRRCTCQGEKARVV